MNVVKATRQFEAWLAQRTHHRPERSSPQARQHEGGTSSCSSAPPTTAGRKFGREVCPDLAPAPQVLAVGDLHVENFGTWRDIEGRLIWGVNDFDEAWPMAYTIDLVRLAVSAHLAVDVGRLPLKREDICATMLEGYREAMQAQRLPIRARREASVAPPHRRRRTPRSRPLLGEDGRTSHAQSRMSGQRRRRPRAP